MICPIAVSMLDDMRAQGLNPTVEDIIYLNALGLRWMAAKNKNAASALDYLPRLAVMSPRLSFRQPTIGHEIWLDCVDRLTEATFETELAVKAFALSRPADQLPDPDDPKAVQVAVETFSRECSDLTREQIFAALDYVLHGASLTDGAVCPSVDSGEDDEDRLPDGTEGEDWKECVALGVLHEGQAVLWGINQAELESMTRRQAEELIRRAYVFQKVGVTSDVERLRDGFYKAYDDIVARLKSSKQL